MLGPNRNSEREAYIFYMAEELPREKIFFLHKYTTNIIKYRDLSGLSIGVLSGAIYFDNFDKDDKLKKLSSIDTPMQLKWFRRVALILLLCLFTKVNTDFTSKILILKNQRFIFRDALPLFLFLESHR